MTISQCRVFIPFLLLLNSCATDNSLRQSLPAEVSMNPDAGRGNWLLITLQLQNGQDLPLVVDTGTPATLLDNSLEPELGKPLGNTDFSSFLGKRDSGIYRAPQLYLGGALLPELPFICTSDLKELPFLSGHPAKGILGMDLLRHYCVQLDFEAGMIRFLNSNELDVATLGKAFPLTFLSKGNINPPQSWR